VTAWFIAHAGGDRPAGSITAADIEGWLGTLDVKPVTRANYVRHLRVFLRYCTKQQYTPHDVTTDVRLERVPRQYPKALRPEEVETVAAYAEAHCRDGAERSSAWATPFIRLGAETGMRRNELLHLTWDRVDLDAGHLVVACTDAFTTKSGAERKLPLSRRALEVLVRLRMERPSITGRVFESGGRPIDPHTCSDTVKRFAVKAGVPRLTPHTLRHTTITRLIERGVPVPIVQRFAGHADIATTMRYCSIADDVIAAQVRGALAA
jgi:integrase